MMMRNKQLSVILIICLLFSHVGVFASTSNTNVGQANDNSLQGILDALKGLSEVAGNLIQKFADMKDNWATEYVAELFNKGAIAGYPDGTFKPNNSINRAEFTKILVTSLDKDPGSFKGGHWATNYLNTAISRGYLKQGEFDNPDKAITRGEMARMISRALDETPQNIDLLKNQLTDFAQIGSEYKDHVAKVYAAGIVTGFPDGSFGPNKTATRAEASTMLVRLLNPGKRKVPKVIKDNVIEIDGQEVKVARKDTVEVFNKALNAFKKGEKHTLLTYNNHDTISISYVPNKDSTIFDEIMCFYVDIKHEKALESDNVISIKEHTEETKKLTQEILKEIFPTGYKKIYQEFESVIYTGTEKSGKADGRTYTVKSFPTSTTIFIGGK